MVGITTRITIAGRSIQIEVVMNEKLVKHLGDASLNLGEAMHEACQDKNFDLSDEILAIVKLTERLEMKITGQPIYRKENRRG